MADQEESAQQEVAASPEQPAAEPAEAEAAAETQDAAAAETPAEEASAEKAEDEGEKPAEAASPEAKEEDVTEEAKPEEEEKKGEEEEGGGGGGGEQEEETEAQEATEAEEAKAEDAEEGALAEPAEGTSVEGEAAEEGAEAVEGEAPQEGAEEHGDLDGIKEEGEEGGEADPEAPLESENFAEGERPESPVAVGEKLSRGATPAIIEEEEEDPTREITQSPPVPGTPHRELEEQPELAEEEEDEEEEEEEEEEEDEEEQQPDFDRDQLIESYNQALQERQQMQEQNYQLQHRLAEYFRKKKSDENRQEVDKNVTDQEQRYLKYMANLDELQRQEGEERDIYREQIEELNRRCNEKQELVDNERQKYMEFKKQIALVAVNSRSGKPILPKDMDQHFVTENRKEGEVVNVRLENIKLKNKLKKKEHQLKSKEELAEGLHLIDFEQLKIENQTYNEKIEERNEELLKLRKKITSTVQVLTHLKEKLQFVQAENHVQKAKLREVEELAARKRDLLSRTKQARDALRIDNQRLRQNCGLLGNEPLLRDFEERKDETDDLKDKLESLRVLHAELTMNLNGVRRKIDQARGGRA